MPNCGLRYQDCTAGSDEQRSGVGYGKIPAGEGIMLEQQRQRKEKKKKKTRQLKAAETKRSKHFYLR